MKTQQPVLPYNEDNSTPDSPLDVDISEDKNIMPSCRSSLPSDITSSSKENNDQIKNLTVKQCTEELISPRILSDMHKKSEKTIRNLVKSSGAQLPLKYREKSQQKMHLHQITKIIQL